MARFDPTVYNQATQAITQTYDRLGNTFAQLMQQRAAQEEARARAEMEKQSDPAYILSLKRQGLPVTPEQQAKLDIAAAKSERYMQDQITGQMVKTGGFPSYTAPQSLAQPDASAPPSVIAAQAAPQIYQPQIEAEQLEVYDPSMTPRERAELRRRKQEELFEKRKEARQEQMQIRKEEREKEADTKKSLINAKSIKRTLDELISDPNLGEISGGFMGLQGLQSDVFPMSETQRRLQPKIDQLQGQKFLSAYETLKGGGQITEVEGLKAEQAQAAINQRMSDKDFKQGLEDYRKVIENGIARLEGKEPPHTFEQPAEGFVVTTQEEYDALPSGAVYIEDGKKYRKP